MSINSSHYLSIRSELAAAGVTLVAVSKVQPVEAILKLYELGQRDFGENYVQELVDKYQKLPKDIRWHFIGHLQTNKVKYIAPFVHLVHGVDSFKLFKEIDKQAAKAQRKIDVLLQVHIAEEETKFGLNAAELEETWKQIVAEPSAHARAVGLMGMASFTSDEARLRMEFEKLRGLFQKYFIDQPTVSQPVLSMGMSGDYNIAVQEGSNMVRIGSLIFGRRT